MMEASINESPIGEDAAPCVRANPTTRELPIADKIQKDSRGRSPPRSTPKTAVESGKSPI